MLYEKKKTISRVRNITVILLNIIYCVLNIFGISFLLIIFEIFRSTTNFVDQQGLHVTAPQVRLAREATTLHKSRYDVLAVQERAPRLTFSAASVECSNSNSSFGCISSKWLEMIFSGVETAFGSLTQLGSSLFNSIGFTLGSLPRLRICRQMPCVLTITLLTNCFMT